MVEKDWNVIAASALFCGCDKAHLPRLLEEAGGYQSDFEPQEVIPFLQEGHGRVGIVLRGKVRVFSSEDKQTLLNCLEPGAMLGVSSLYTANGAADTFMTAAVATRILFFDETMLDPIWENPVTRKNLIFFLSGRIRFLTEKIASFTSPDTETKLARYLKKNMDENAVVSGFRSYCELAKTLHLGRASLYRALDKMEESGFIRRQGKTICILNPDKIG